MKSVKFIIGFFPFMIRPSFVNIRENVYIKVLNTLIFLIIYLIIAFIVYFIANSLGLAKYFQVNEISTKLKSVYYILLLVFVGPIFEEVSFRLPLKYSKINTIILICSLIAIILNYSISWPFLHSYKYIRLILMAFVLFIVIYSIFHNNKLIFDFFDNLFQKHNTGILYFITFSFATFHVNALILTSLFATILIILNKSFSGFILSYLRIKYGMVYCVLLHILINLSAVIFAKILLFA